MLIDLIGYRRFGHNESDEPAYTQPEMYAKIKDQKRVSELWADGWSADGVVTQEEVEQQAAGGLGRPDAPPPARCKRRSREVAEQRRRALAPASTSSTARRAPTSRPRSPAERLRELDEQLLRVPEGFTVHPKLVASSTAAARRSPTTAARDRLGARRGARVRVAARRGHADPPHRPGHRARHLQPAPPRPARRQHRPDGLPDPEPARRSRRRSSCTTARSPSSAASASSTATARRRRRRSCCGRRSSATSSTARR